ncbi:MAG: TonB-dependent receptor [Pseudomonadota bacterium]
MSIRSILAASVAASAVGAGFAAPAAAQEAGEDDAMTMNRVTVTAQRREEDLQDVPIAITAFSPEDLEALQISEPLDIIDYVPNFYGGNNTGLGSANVYFIRGLGNVESIATFDPAVGTYVDEIYLARQNGNNVAFFDVEGIEVLRGPQGTLFGRNTTGGAVVIRMAKPDEEFGGFVEGGFGSFDRFSVRGSVDLPVNETFLTKISAFYVDEDGFVENPVTGETLNGQNAFGFRGDFRVLMTDAITLDVSAEYSEDEGLNLLNTVEGGSVLALPSGPGQRISNTGLSSAENDGAPLERILAGEGLGVSNETTAITANFEVDTGPGVFNLIFGWRDLEQSFTIDFFDGGLGGQGFPTGGFTIANDGDHEQVSIEAKYFASYLDGMLDITSGVFYFEESNVTDFADVFTVGSAAAPFPIVLADRVLFNDTSSIAVYSQADFRPIDPLTLTVGVRWTQEDKEIAIFDNQGVGPGTLNTENLLLAGIPTDIRTSLVTPRFVINWDFNEDVSVFASATNGFKSGGWNARGTDPSFLTNFGREEVWSYEGGLRTLLFDERIRFNATGFFLDVNDLQVISGVGTASGSIEFLTDNFADLETYGVELDTQILVNEDFTLFGSFGWQESEYDSIDPTILAQQQACLDAIAVGGSTAGLCEAGIVTPDGAISEPVRIPPITVAAGGAYDFAFPQAGVIVTPNFNVRYVGEAFVATDNQPNSFEDGYFLVNAGVTLATDDGAWQLIGECSNCTNTIYLQSDLANTLYLNEPRRWGFRLKHVF